MIAAWDWHLPRTTEDEEDALVRLAHATGFDTLIVPTPTPAMVDRGRELGVRVVAIVTPAADDAFTRQHPQALQQMLAQEDKIGEIVEQLEWESYTVQAHRWFPIVQMAPLLCFEQPAAQTELKRRVAAALAVADGVAFDGFGFANHYGCFCPRCHRARIDLQDREPTRHAADVLATQSEKSLVALSHLLYDHAKNIQSDALVTNHLWPPFRPHPAYGARLKLDFCSQTISWFYKPHWSLQRVAFEAAEMKRLEVAENNRFAPFIGMFHQPFLARSGARIAAELAIAQQYGEGNLIFCSLKAIHDHADVADAVRTALASSPAADQ